MLNKLIEKYINDFSNQLNKVLVGRVVKYDHEKLAVDIEIATYTDTPFPIIPDVPVVFPKTSNASLILPVTIGDRAVVCFSDASLEAWKASGVTAKTPDNRRHNLTDAIAILGIEPTQGGDYPETANELKLSYNNSYIKITEDGDIEIQASGDVRINGNRIDLN